MPVAWYPARWQDWNWPVDEKVETEPAFTNKIGR